MGTEVLRPQDWLIERIRVSPEVFPRRRSCYGTARPNYSNRKPVVRPPEQKRRFNNQPPEPTVSKISWSSEDLRPTTKYHNNRRSHNLVMGQVMILRKGESLDSKSNSETATSLKQNSVGDGLVVCGTGRLGPDAAMVPKQFWISPASFSSYSAGNSDVYAGSAFSLSPSPSSLPLPSFFNKKQGSKTVDDSATRDLRRLLRLD